MDVLIHKKFQDDLTRYLFKVYQEKTLCDTVIHTPDGGAFQVHKIIVTASSTYLHNVLSQASQVHSSFSVDVRADILQVLLEFMYTGQLFVSDLTRSAVSEAATYLQIYPVIDLLKEIADENLTPNAEDKPITEIPQTTTGYDSENTIVDDNELLATFNTSEEEKRKHGKGRKKHPRKQRVTARRLRKYSTKETYTAIKVEKDDDAFEKIEKGGKNQNVTAAENEPDNNPDTVNKKQFKKSYEMPRTRQKGLSLKSGFEPSTKMVLRNSKVENKKSKSELKEGLRQKSKRKSKPKYEVEETVKKIKIKREKLKAVADKMTAKDKKLAKSKEKTPVKVKDKRKKSVIVMEENEPDTAIQSQSKSVKTRKVYKPSKQDRCVCEYCKETFPGFVFLRKHLLVCHKHGFVHDWEFSRYLIKFYSGIIRNVGNCTVDNKSNKHKYRCTECMNTFSKYSLYCLHFQRRHMKKNLKLHGKFFIISQKLKHLENFLSGILQARHKKDVKLKSAPKLQNEMKVKKVKTAECSHCNKRFVNDLTLRVHQKKMHGIEPVRKYRIGVKDEKKNREATKLFPCALCETEKFMVSQYALQKHLRDFHRLDDETARMKSHDVPYDLKCEVISCGFTTNNILQMKTHVAYSHPFIQHPCNECNMVFQVRLMLERHRFYKHSVKQPCNYMCAHCDKRFPKQFRLKVHEFYKHGIEHADIKIYRCDAPGCQYVTASQSSLRVHGSKHLKEKPFTCEFCGMKLKTTLSHQKHINKMHLGIRPYLCQVCGQSFGEDHELKSHIRNKHTTECDYQCEHCPYATTNKGTFYTHLYNVHKVRAEDDKRKEFRCPHPGCKFVSILHHRFQTHLNGHTNTRTYCCKPCNKWFVSSSTLRAHKQWYHSDKLHSCTQCTYQTKTSQKLNEHIRVQHQLKGLKPFKCPYCDFRCATGGNTRKHVKQVHRGKVVTYLRDDSILNAAKRARASGQNQPLINIFPAERLHASVPSSYPASAKKLGILPETDEIQMMPEMNQEEGGPTLQLVATKLETEQMPTSVGQIPEPPNQMILSSEHLDVVSPPDPRTQGPVDLGAQVTVDLNSQIPTELRSQLSADLQNQIPPELRCQITAGLRNQLAADLRNQISSSMNNQIPADLHNQLSVEQTMQLSSSGHHIPFSAGHYISTVSGSHHIPLTSHHLMPMMVAPQVQVSVENYEEVKDNGGTSNLTIIG